MYRNEIRSNWIHRNEIISIKITKNTAQSGTKVTVQEKYKQINKERNMNMYLAFSYLVKTMTKES